VVLVGIEATSDNLLKLNTANLGLISRFAGHENSVTSLLLYENLLFSGSADNTIICWDFDNETLIRVFRGHTELVSSLTIINDELYSGGFDRIIIKWNRYNGQIITIFPRVHRNYVRCLAHYANLLFSGSTDTTAIGWNLTTVLPSVIYKGRPRIIPSIFLWKNLVISGSRDSEVRLWDTSKNSLEPFLVLTENTDAINCLHLHNDLLFSGSADWTIRQWNISTLSFMQVMRGKIPFKQKFTLGHSSSLSALTAGETSLYSGSLDAIIIKWDYMTGNQVAQFSAHSFQITTLLYQFETVYSGSWDESIIAWDVRNSVILRTYQGKSVLK
jgi:WD40 repeat protein